MNKKEASRQAARTSLIHQIGKMGHPMEFGALIADSLGTEKSMRRMSAYLNRAGRQTAEQIADEMLAILDQRSRWIEKKKNEYYNQKYNEMRYTVLGMDEDDEEE